MAAQEQQESLYSDSVCSSPRSVGGTGRGNDEEQRVRFMCSYGGRILPRPHDNQLRYVGGETRIQAVSRNITYSLLISKLSKLCGNNVTVKYQLPNEDLDALISVTTDEDLENMMEEYDRLNSGDRSSRLRLFLFPAKLENATSLGSLLEGSKREHWFLDALNGLPSLTRRRSEVSSVASEVPDYLFGLDNVEEWDREERNSTKPSQGPGKSRLNLQHVTEEEVHSAPGSPVPISSPYGSTSSAPPSIDTHIIAERAVKAEKFALHSPMVVEDQTTKLAEKSSKLPEVVIVKQEVPVEIEDVNSLQSRSLPMKREGSNSSIASMKREGSGSNLSAQGEESKVPTRISPDDRNKPFHTDEIYKQPPGIMTQQQITTDHYVEYTHPSQFLGQPPANYWQMQEDPSGQVYYVPAGAVQTIARQPSYIPLQRMPLPLPATVPYVSDTNQGMQQKMTATISAQGSYPVRSPGKAPLYRSPIPRPVSPIMMRPPVPSSDQYAYQQVQVAYEAAAAATNAAPQQIYYTQRPTVMNPQYHQPIMAPVVGVDLQTSSESNTEGSAFGRVSGSV